MGYIKNDPTQSKHISANAAVKWGSTYVLYWEVWGSKFRPGE